MWGPPGRRLMILEVTTLWMDGKGQDWEEGSTKNSFCPPHRLGASDPQQRVPIGQEPGSLPDFPHRVLSEAVLW